MSTEGDVLAAATKVAAEHAAKWIGRLAASLAESTKYRLLGRAKARLETFGGEQLLRYSRLRTLALRDRLADLEDVYVPLTLMRSADSDNDIRVDGRSRPFLSKGLRMWVLDDAGMGKSTLTRYLVVNALRKGSFLPILIEMRTVNVERPLQDHIREHVGLPAADGQDDLYGLLNSGNVVVVFDGLDEVPVADRKRMYERLQLFSTFFKDTPMVFTARPEQSVQLGLGTSYFRIAPLSFDQAKALIVRYGAGDEISRRLIAELEQPEKRAPVEEFLVNPLLVSLLYGAYRYHESLPALRHLFFRQVFDALFEDHDVVKSPSFVRAKSSGLDRDRFHRVLRGLGLLHSVSNTFELPKARMLQDISKAVHLVGEANVSSTALLDDLVHAVPLMQYEGLRVRWNYRSLAEYFAAEFIARDAGSKQRELFEWITEAAQCSRLINVIDLLREIAPTLFRQVVVRRLLSQFVAHAENPGRFADWTKLTERQRELRLGLTFEVTHTIKPVDYIKDAESVFRGTGFESELSCRSRGISVHAIRSGTRSLLALLLRDRPDLFTEPQAGCTSDELAQFGLFAHRTLSDRAESMWHEQNPPKERRGTPAAVKEGIEARRQASNASREPMRVEELLANSVPLDFDEVNKVLVGAFQPSAPAILSLAAVVKELAEIEREAALQSKGLTQILGDRLGESNG